MKKLISMCLSLLLLVTLTPWGMCVDLVADFDETKELTQVEEELELSYQNIIEYADENGIPLEMDFEAFVEEYLNSGYESISAYEEAYYELFSTNESSNNIDDDVDADGQDSSSSGSDKWYYNTGLSLPRTANYNKYNLLSVVEKGDIIFESKGGFGITGHIAIVEGKYYSAARKQFYIRVIEAVKPDGLPNGAVCRGVLDDERVDDKGVSVLRVSIASNTKINTAIEFCKSQLGKEYDLDIPNKDTEANQPDWYCSELVWAAYYRQGIDIETTNTVNQPGITPLDIQACDKLTYCGISGTRPENVLQDISGHWANSYIKYAVKNGLMSGTSSNRFQPDLAVTRAMMSTVLYSMENKPTVGNNLYTDVANGMWYTDAVTWVSNNGIAEGYSNTIFGPNDSVIREQAALMLYRYAQYKGYSTAYSSSILNQFTDRGNVSVYAVTAMKWAVSNGIMSGTSSTTLSPKSTITRAQLATMLKALVENTAQ